MTASTGDTGQQEPPQHNHAWQTPYVASCKPGCPYYDFVPDGILDLHALADTICGVVCSCGPNLEPLACGWKRGHDGPHAWSTLPTFYARPAPVPAACRDPACPSGPGVHVRSGSCGGAQ